MSKPSQPTVVALYLPQYHPIPENDGWWGTGFTEWTNVTKAKPLFPGHHQPDLPSDLGFYDLRVPETRGAQAALARRYGVGAFCYYHYWFGSGRQLLNRPFDEVVASGAPDFPFMLCWANQTWSGVWHGLESQVLIEQTYPGAEDDQAHFDSLLPAFQDRRYVRVDDKPVFMVYRHGDIPDTVAWAARWQAMARAAGLPGLYLLTEDARTDWDPRSIGFDAYVNIRGIVRRRPWVSWSEPLAKIKGKLQQLAGLPTLLDARNMVDTFVPEQAGPWAIPCAVPNWDNTPRSGRRGVVVRNSSPDLFERQLQRAMSRTLRSNRPDQLVFVKSWNEWAEGNYLEPGRRWGHQFLERIAAARAATMAGKPEA